MTLIRHPFRFFSVAIRFVYKKNKQQVYLFDLKKKKGKGTLKMPETGGSSPERGAGGCMTTRLLASHTGAQRGEKALHWA